MPTLKLTYFDAPGRAESIRVTLTLAGLPFEDHRIRFTEFAELKASGAFPLGSVPVLAVDGVQLTQTGAMLRYAARAGEGDLYPDEPFAALIVDSALDTFNDTLSHALMPSLFEQDAAKKLEMRAAFSAGPLQRACAYVEGLIERSGGPFVNGGTLTIADVVIALQILQIQSGGLDGIDAEAIASFPRVQALAAAYLEDPRVVAYRQK